MYICALSNHLLNLRLLLRQSDDNVGRELIGNKIVDVEQVDEQFVIL